MMSNNLRGLYSAERVSASGFLCDLYSAEQARASDCMCEVYGAERAIILKIYIRRIERGQDINFLI